MVCVHLGLEVWEEAAVAKGDAHVHMANRQSPPMDGIIGVLN